MIAKKYRLSERALKKVFSHKKPFFSYFLIANVKRNKCGHARVGILLSKKHTPGSVNRNTFRRKFYDNTCEILPYEYDVVVVLKKGTVLSHKNQNHIRDFEKNIHILIKQLISHFSLGKTSNF